MISIILTTTGLWYYLGTWDRSIVVLAVPALAWSSAVISSNLDNSSEIVGAEACFINFYFSWQKSFDFSRYPIKYPGEDFLGPIWLSSSKLSDFLLLGIRRFFGGCSPPCNMETTEVGSIIYVTTWNILQINMSTGLSVIFTNMQYHVEMFKIQSSSLTFEI